MNQLLERFLRYVKIDTQADETSITSPSTVKQLDLSRLLAAGEAFIQRCEKSSSEYLGGLLHWL